MDKLEMKTKSKVDVNIEAVGKLFPDTITEVIKGYDEKGNPIYEKAIDFDVLKQELSKVIVEGKQERYQMNWPGKKEAILEANSPINKTLRPCREESVDFDKTENLYIEGDNLDVLKLLQETYLNKVKMIYIDPPYNTGNDSFVYPDNFAMDGDEFSEASGQYDEDGNMNYDIRKNGESNGKFHSDWLNMMYPRLKLAKDLLSDEGVIFISIDDNEVHNIKKVCDEIFGSNNFFGEIIVQSNKGGQDYKDIARTHEYLICYGKSDLTTLYEIEREDVNLKYKDDKGTFDIRELRNRNPKFGKFNRPNLFYPVYANKDVFDENGLYSVSLYKSESYTIEILPLNSEGKESCWRWGKEKFDNNNNSIINSANIVAKPKNTGGWNVYEKYRKTTQKVKTIWDETGMRTENGTIQLRELSLKGIFDHPKPTDIIEKCIRISANEDDIILDFFSGSATTAHAVMQLNAEDGGNRKFIMVQIPEPCDEKSEAYKAGYKNVCEIGKERIKRAGKKIKEEHPEAADTLDTGFRVFKVDSSNMKDVFYNPTEYKQTLLDNVENNIKEDRSGEDLLFQVMLDLGELLSSDIQEIEIEGKKVFNVGKGDIIACFDENITDEVVTKIAKMEPLYAVFRDSSLSSDAVATNFDQIFKTYSPGTIRKVL